MNILSTYNITENFNYFGNCLTIPDTIRYIATDADGMVYGYTGVPKRLANYREWSGMGGVELAKAEVGTFNWKESLVEV